MSQYPHTSVLTRLHPSPIHGIGVFAICDIPSGTRIFPNDTFEVVWFDQREIDTLSLTDSIRAFYRDFCIRSRGRYGCPLGFDILTVAWYLNEPSPGNTPNVFCDSHYDFHAARNITIGEELTVDYSTFSERNSKHPNA